MVLAQPPENFHAVSWLDGEEVQTTPVLGFGFYWHGRHDQPLSAPGRIACRLCRPSRKAGDRVTNHPRHSQLPVVAISAGSATQNEVKRRVRGGEHGQLVLRELFAGKATLTEQWRRQGGKALEPVEVFRDPHTREGYQSEHDLMKPEIRARHLARAKEGPENIGWVAAPCTSYCDWNLENGGSRTFTQPQGGSGRALTEREQEGNVLSTFAANYFEAMLDAGGFPMAESSGCSGRYPKQWDLPCWRRILQRPDVDFVEFRMCSFGLGPPDEPGAFYQHLTRVVFPRHDAVRAVLSRRCPGVSANHRHVALKGARPGVQITRCTEAGVYCPEFVQTVCQVLRDSLFVGGLVRRGVRRTRRAKELVASRWMKRMAMKLRQVRTRMKLRWQAQRTEMQRTQLQRMQVQRTEVQRMQAQRTEVQRTLRVARMAQRGQGMLKKMMSVTRLERRSKAKKVRSFIPQRKGMRLNLGHPIGGHMQRQQAVQEVQILGPAEEGGP